MKKKLSLILAAAMLLSGCNTDKTTENTTTTSAVTTTSVTTAAPVTTTTATTTKAATTAPVTAETTTTTSKPTTQYISAEEYLKKHSSFSNAFFNGESLYSLWYRGCFSYIGDGKAVCDDPMDNNYYHSPKGVLLAGDEIPLLDMVVNELENATFKNVITDNYTYYSLKSDIELDNPYEFSCSPVTLDIEKCTTGGSVYLNDATYSLYTEKEITVNCFIRKNDDTAEVIVDPMYAYYLPYDSEGNSENIYYHTINGTETVMTSPSVIAKADEEALSALTEEYIYCTAVLDDYTMNVFLSKQAEFSCTLKSFEIIEQNGADALTKTYLNFDSEEKPDKMSEMYNALLEIKDKWYNEDCFGMLLLDLDFDEIPEVLLSGFTRDDEGNFINRTTSIYRLVNGKLEFADSFIPATGFERGDGDLTSYTDENGNKKWYVGMYTTEERKTDGYYQPADSYIRGFMTFDENGIEFEEIFSYWKTDRTDESVLFYMGELFSENADIYEEAIVHQSEQYDGYALEWSAQYVFSERLNDEAYYLASSEFIYDAYIYSALVPQTERMLAYNTAKIVDDGFLGVCHKGRKDFMFGGAYAKPVIYLYPEEETSVSVQLDFDGELTCTYPEYNNGWNVTAEPDGTLYDENGNEYYCLYWEGEGGYNLDFSEGFCVKGGDTADFLREKLLYMGLTAREANEFIIYWLPVMQENPYNVITFHTEDYANAVPLTVSPAPDSVIRVFMTFRASENEITIAPQSLPQYERDGFTLIEWGGGEI